MISRLKIMADMNIAERRVPQDGRIEVRHQGKEFDLRVSSVPTPFGEKIVMRILDKSSVMIGLNKLGFTEENQLKIEELNSPVILGVSEGAGKYMCGYKTVVGTVPLHRPYRFWENDHAVLGFEQVELRGSQHFDR